MNENSRLDENSRPTSTATLDAPSEFVRRLRVNPSTNRLLVTIYAVDDDSSELNDKKVDENSVETITAVTDDLNNDVRPLQVDSRNGYLYCDVT